MERLFKRFTFKIRLPEVATMLREAWDEKLAEQQTQGEKPKVDEDFREW